MQKQNRLITTAAFLKVLSRDIKKDLNTLGIIKTTGNFMVWHFKVFQV